GEQSHERWWPPMWPFATRWPSRWKGWGSRCRVSPHRSLLWASPGSCFSLLLPTKKLMQSLAVGSALGNTLPVVSCVQAHASRLPMPPDPSFDALMNRLQAGDQDAAVQIFDRFTRRLIGLARAHLDTLIRQKVD